MLRRSWFPDRLDGNLVYLRRHVPENLAAFRRWYTDPEVARLTRYQDGPMGTDEIERFFAARVVGSESLALAVHIRQTGRLIGTCAFSQLDSDNGSALFHITIGEKDCWGRGYGTEATRLMLDHAFGTLGIHRIALSVFGFNERAIRAYQRVGFVVEGRARQAIWRDGRFWDELQMSMLEEEWRERRAHEGSPESPEAAPLGEMAEPARAAEAEAAVKTAKSGSVKSGSVTSGSGKSGSGKAGRTDRAAGVAGGG